MTEQNELPENQENELENPPPPYTYPVAGGEDGAEDGYTDGDDNWHPGQPPA